MEIDNSRAQAFRNCPWEYYEKYVRNGTGVEPIPQGESYGPLDFGSRVHELLQEHYLHNTIYTAHENDALEMEAQVMMEAYKAHYPDEQFDVVDVERGVRIALPEMCESCISFDVRRSHDNYLGIPVLICQSCGRNLLAKQHVFIGKMDLIVRSNGLLDIYDHKTQNRNAKSNLPQKWNARDQASLYWWALEKLYGPNQVENFYVNVLVRQSPKGQEPPFFPERQKLERSARQKDMAIRDLIIIANDIEKYTRVFGNGEWPANREKCYDWTYCPYYQIHRYGEDPTLILEHRYRAKKEYLNLAGVPIIQ